MCGFPYVYRCTYTSVCRCVKAKVTVRCQSSGVIHLVLQDMDVPWGLGFASEAKDGQGAAGILSLPPQCRNYKEMPQAQLLKCGCWGSTPGPHACLEST